MKQTFFALTVLFALSGSAQFMEFGGGLGITNYSGDLVRGLNFNTSSFAGTAFYRMNLSEIVTLRLSATFGNVKGSETPIDALAVERNQSFNNSIVELSGVFEYHFLDFKSEKSPYNWSPYIFAGFGFVNLGEVPPNSGVNKLQTVLPFGFGVKHLISKRYTLGFEAGARKTFFDYLDGISDGDQTIKDFQYGNPNDDDWYFFTGITFSITLFNIPCPFPYRPNNSILAR